jgi:hypothetical protein
MSLKSAILRKTWYRSYVFSSLSKNYQNSRKVDGLPQGHSIPTYLTLIKACRFAPRGLSL